MNMNLQLYGGRGSGGGKGGGGGFKAGDTPKAIVDSKVYDVKKLTSRGNSNYGTLSGSDVKPMLKGYKYNGLFWSKDSSTTIYDIREV